MFLNDTWEAGIGKKDFLDGEIEAYVSWIDKVKNIKKLVALGSYGGVTKSMDGERRQNGGIDPATEAKHEPITGLRSLDLHQVLLEVLEHFLFVDSQEF